MVTENKDESSTAICKLPPETIVTVETIEQKRCRISAPSKGWISLYTDSGYSAIDQCKMIPSIGKYICQMYGWMNKWLKPCMFLLQYLL